jgi:hypothetical protein
MTETAQHTLTETERRLIEIWAEVLALDEIVPDDTFLGLGGESISAMLCVNRLRMIFNADIPVRTLLAEQTTLRTLATLIDGSHGGSASAGANGAAASAVTRGPQ